MQYKVNKKYYTQVIFLTLQRAKFQNNVVYITNNKNIKKKIQELKITWRVR